MRASKNIVSINCNTFNTSYCKILINTMSDGTPRHMQDCQHGEECDNVNHISDRKLVPKCEVRDKKDFRDEDENDSFSSLPLSPLNTKFRNTYIIDDNDMFGEFSAYMHENDDDEDDEYSTCSSFDSDEYSSSSGEDDDDDEDEIISVNLQPESFISLLHIQNNGTYKFRQESEWQQESIMSRLLDTYKSSLDRTRKVRFGNITIREYHPNSSSSSSTSCFAHFPAISKHLPEVSPITASSAIELSLHIETEIPTVRINQDITIDLRDYERMRWNKRRALRNSKSPRLGLAESISI
jgi:hypothetical protein